MENSNKKANKIITRFLIATVITFFLFVFAFLAYAVKEGFAETVKLHAKGLVDLFAFKYNGGDNIAYLALSPFLIALIICWLVFLVAGLYLNNKKDSKLMWVGIVLTLVNLLVYSAIASGFDKFWQILNSLSDKVAFTFVLLLVVFGALYFVLAIVFYFWSIVELFMDDQEEKVVIEVSDDHIRDIVQDELVNSKLFKSLMANNQQQTIVIYKKKGQPVRIETKYQPVQETVEEPVKEEQPVEPQVEQPVETPIQEPEAEIVPETHAEPAKEVKAPKKAKKAKKVVEPEPQPTPKVDFWEIAREVWPQLDNPKPLQKEEK